MNEIQSSFGDRVISKGILPPRSPLSDAWGYLKGAVSQNKPRTIDALKAHVTEYIQAENANVLARNFHNMARRVQSCLGANGGQFQQIL
jgi:hypothetical protein